MNLSRSRAACVAFSLAASALLSGVASAQQTHPVITRVVVDAGQLVISGTGFCDGPVVTFGGDPLAAYRSGADILAQLPADLMPGGYLLVVECSKGRGAPNRATWNFSYAEAGNGGAGGGGWQPQGPPDFESDWFALNQDNPPAADCNGLDYVVRHNLGVPLEGLYVRQIEKGTTHPWISTRDARATSYLSADGETSDPDVLVYPHGCDTSLRPNTIVRFKIWIRD